MMYTITLGTEMGDLDCQVVLSDTHWYIKAIYKKFDNEDLRLTIEDELFHNVTRRLENIVSAMREDRCVL